MSKPEIVEGIDDVGTWWYRCPACHDELEYEQKKCGYCGQRIDWGAEDGDITVYSVVKGKDGEQG